MGHIYSSNFILKEPIENNYVIDAFDSYLKANGFELYVEEFLILNEYENLEEDVYFLTKYDDPLTIVKDWPTAGSVSYSFNSIVFSSYYYGLGPFKTDYINISTHGKLFTKYINQEAFEKILNKIHFHFDCLRSFSYYQHGPLDWKGILNKNRKGDFTDEYEFDLINPSNGIIESNL